MNITIEKTVGGFYAGSVPVTEPECDIARSISKYPLRHGATVAGTSYDRESDQYSLSLQAKTREEVAPLLEDWIREIRLQQEN